MDALPEDLARVLRDATGVLFLCSGNMIRSAYAELYARHVGCSFPVASAATRFENDAIYVETARALRRRGVSEAWIEAFRPTTLWSIEHEVDPRSVIFGMTREHLVALTRPELVERAFLLPALLGREDEIADPLFEGNYEEAFATIEVCVGVLVG